MIARNRTRETRTRRFLFDHAFLAVQPGAINVRIAGPKGARVKVARRTEDATLLRIDFGSRLYSGKGATLRLTFDLPGQGKDASPQVRVGTSLVTMPVLGVRVHRGPGQLGRGALPARLGRRRGVGRARAPRRPPPTGGPCSRPVRSRPRSTSSPSSPPQRPAVYVDRPLTVPVEGQDVELLLQAWQDDPGWADRTGSLLAAVLPALRGDIGLPWPAEDPLVIHETAGRDADASAGVFDPAQNRIDVAYWADRGVVIHQAAHGWFNGDLLADRWANEGFATFYALRAAEQLGESADSPQMTDEAAGGVVPAQRVGRERWPGDHDCRRPVRVRGLAGAREGARRAGGHGRPGRGLGRCRRRDGGLSAAAAGYGGRRRGGRGRANTRGRRRRPGLAWAARPARGPVRPGPDPALARVGRTAGRGGVARCTGARPAPRTRARWRWPTAGSCRARSATRSGAWQFEHGGDADGRRADRDRAAQRGDRARRA